MTEPAAPNQSPAEDQRKGLFAEHGIFYGLVIGQQTNINAASAPQLMPIVEAQALLDQLPLDDIPAPQTLPTPHRMPLATNPLFVGRDEDFRALAALLKAGTAAVITTGIGGMGKTQLAAEVAHRYGAYFAGGVFWVSCADPAGVAAEAAACGRLMGLPLDGKDQETQVQLTRAEWAKDVPRLLILDNCEE
ncbi:MAG TPA: hypothetical protein VFS21_30945 [Roseiflexaceae bacterium]|nr:hypothetical protein [Roseiflexaceae bacterium]